MVSRSNISVVRAVPQPLPTPPTTASASSLTSSKKTSLNSASPEIWRRPRMVTPGRVHVDDEHRQALVLGHVGVGARQQQAVGGELRVGRPHLLAVQRPGAVVVAPGPRLDAGQVGAGGRLGEQLAPDLVAVQHRPQVARLLLVAAVRDDRRPEHAHADHVEDAGDAGRADLLVDDHLLDRPAALAAELLGPHDAGQTALGELALPRAPGGEVGLLVAVVVAARRRRLAAVLLEPLAYLGAVRGLLGRVVQIHPQRLLVAG